MSYLLFTFSKWILSANFFFKCYWWKDQKYFYHLFHVSIQITEEKTIFKKVSLKSKYMIYNWREMADRQETALQRPLLKLFIRTTEAQLSIITQNPLSIYREAKLLKIIFTARYFQLARALISFQYELCYEWILIA